MRLLSLQAAAAAAEAERVSNGQQIRIVTYRTWLCAVRDPAVCERPIPHVHLYIHPLCCVFFLFFLSSFLCFNFTICHAPSPPPPSPHTHIHIHTHVHTGDVFSHWRSVWHCITRGIDFLSNVRIEQCHQFALVFDVCVFLVLCSGHQQTNRGSFSFYLFFVFFLLLFSSFFSLSLFLPSHLPF